MMVRFLCVISVLRVFSPPHGENTRSCVYFRHYYYTVFALYSAENFTYLYAVSCQLVAKTSMHANSVSKIIISKTYNHNLPKTSYGGENTRTYLVTSRNAQTESPRDFF